MTGAEMHVQRGGISRYHKFEYFLEHILGVALDPQQLDGLLASYATIVRAGLLTCEVAPGLQQLRQATPQSRWLVVSGGDQMELRQIFAERGLSPLFDGGIFGSPDTKEEIFVRELANCNIMEPAVFLGDSKYDYLAAGSADLDFIFLSQWTEFQDWRSFCTDHKITYYYSFFEF